MNSSYVKFNVLSMSFSLPNIYDLFQQAFEELKLYDDDDAQRAAALTTGTKVYCLKQIGIDCCYYHRHGGLQSFEKYCVC